jgi:hypothetical protein
VIPTRKLEGHAPSCALNFGRVACDCKLTLERVDRELDELEALHGAALRKHDTRLQTIEELLKRAGIYADAEAGDL